MGDQVWHAGADSERSESFPSRRWQASYVRPETIRHKAPVTFETAEDAEAWLTDRRREINNENWTPPTTRRPITFGEHAERWLKTAGLLLPLDGEALLALHGARRST